MKEYTVEVTSTTTVTVEAEDAESAIRKACETYWEQDADAVDGKIVDP